MVLELFLCDQPPAMALTSGCRSTFWAENSSAIKVKALSLSCFLSALLPARGIIPSIKLSGVSANRKGFALGRLPSPRAPCGVVINGMPWARKRFHDFDLHPGAEPHRVNDDVRLFIDSVQIGHKSHEHDVGRAPFFQRCTKRCHMRTRLNPATAPDTAGQQSLMKVLIASRLGR